MRSAFGEAFATGEQARLAGFVIQGIFGLIFAVYSPMQRLILLILLALTQLSRAESLEWLGDLESAKERAQQEKKFILVYFTGSDWCPWCKKLSNEIFIQPDFADFARSKFVLVEADFPRWRPIGNLQMEGN